MAREKVVVRKKGNHSAENMLKALKLHRKGMSIRKAAKECNIAYPTLRRYVVKNLNVPIENLADERLTPNYENHLIFTQEQEVELKNYIVDCALRFYGLTVKKCRKVAYQMAMMNQIPIPDTWKIHKMAGKEWFRSFKKRHPNLSVKKPEQCSLARATAFNRETVKTFFDNLKTVLERHPSFGTGCRVYNLDETATTTVQKPSKVVAPKGRQNIAKVTSGEKGTLVTTCAIVCASGHALPPVLVFPRKNFKDLMLHGAPPGTLGLANKSGWMTSELFVEVMRHFISQTSANLENPALLILDNHESHLSIEALDLAKSHGVTILTLHPHTTSKLQPLDVGLNAPFKVFYNNAVDSWMLRNPGKSVTIYNVAECVGVAYAKAMTPVNIAAAFKKCGIFPFNRDVFTDIDFLPSEVTNRPQELVEERENLLTPAQDSDATDCNDDPNKTPSPSVFDIYKTPEKLSMSDKTKGAPAVNPRKSVTPEKETIEKKNDTPMLSTIPQFSRVFKSAQFISPKQFMPPIKAGPRSNTRKNRKPGKSRIATDTPEKNEIMMDRQKKKCNKKKVQGIKRVLQEKKNEVKVPKKKKVKYEVLEETSSEDELEEVPLMSETDISENNGSEDEETLTVIRGNFQQLPRKPKEGDYVLIIFDLKKSKVFYVAKVIEENDSNYYGVSYMRVKNKERMKFVMPLEPDLAEVKLADIKMILPPPQINGTKNRSSFYIFPVRVAPTINLR